MYFTLYLHSKEIESAWLLHEKNDFSLFSLCPLSPPSGHALAGKPLGLPPDPATCPRSGGAVRSEHPPACGLQVFVRFIRKTQFSCPPGNDSGWLGAPGTQERQMWL